MSNVIELALVRPIAPCHTPWGPSQSQHTVAPGITHHETSSHGGMHVSDELVALIPAAWRAYAAKWSGSVAWYEEDVAWAAVAITFAHLFEPKVVEYARVIAIHNLPKLDA